MTGPENKADGCAVVVFALIIGAIALSLLYVIGTR